jgi:hypothetical protein
MPAQSSAAALDVDTEYQALLARAGAKDRASIERHVAACDAEPDAAHGNLWRRVAARLGTLASLPVTTLGQHAVLFFIPDGKYRMQVFALEDKRDGQLQVYVPDVLADAAKKKILGKSTEEGKYAIPGAGKQTLEVIAMDAANTPEPPQHVKNMLGWNRKALRISLPTTEAKSAAVSAAESLASLAAAKWAAKAKA